MAYILSLETSSKICSVAIHQDSDVLASAEIHISQSHASKLGILIEDVMKFADIRPKDLSAVAVSSGPGSYTGLRIGVSTAKGLCFSLGIPLIAVGTLELLASQMRKFVSRETLLCPMIDARRMEVYCMLVDDQLNQLTPIEPKIITEETFSDKLRTHPIIFFGDGAPKCKGTITAPNAFFIDDVNPSVVHLGGIASKKLSSNQFEDLVNFEPIYLKEFAVKRSLK